MHDDFQINWKVWYSQATPSRELVLSAILLLKGCHDDSSVLGDIVMYVWFDCVSHVLCVLSAGPDPFAKPDQGK